MKYYVECQDHYELGTWTEEFDKLNDALDRADVICDDGGSACVSDDEGNIYFDE